MPKTLLTDFQDTPIDLTVLKQYRYPFLDCLMNDKLEVLKQQLASSGLCVEMQTISPGIVHEPMTYEHDRLIIVIDTCGTIEVRLGDEVTLELSNGDAICIPEGIEYAFFADAEFPSRCLVCTYDSGS